VLPEQGQSLGSLVCSRASSRRHGAATSSARACRLGYLILSVGRGFSPAPVATADGDAIPARLAVATTHASRACACARARRFTPRNAPVCQPIPVVS
jgi:hypothetical protein